MLNPTLRILLYVCSAVALPWLSHLQLVLLATLVAVATHRRWPAVFRLLGRARWLFLLLGLGYAYSLPGAAAVAWLGAWSPSWPGIAVGVEHMVRLGLLLALLEWLVLGLGHEHLLVGLFGLLRPLRVLQFPVEATTVRLGLTLETMQSRRFDRRALSGILSEADLPRSGRETYSFTPTPWRTIDSLALLLGVALAVWAWRSA